MTYHVAISDQQQALSVDRSKLQEIVRRTLQDEEVIAAEISLALVDDVTMQELNRQYLNHDYATDVLSFGLEIEQQAPKMDEESSRLGTGKRIEGEIIVSTDTAVRQGALHGLASEDEMALYLVHGLLHLCGYEDNSGENRSRMRSREAEILQFWGLTPNYGRGDSSSDG